MEMAISSDDWEHHVVNPLLHEMHCGDDEYFNAQDVSDFLHFCLTKMTKIEKEFAICTALCGEPRVTFQFHPTTPFPPSKRRPSFPECV